MESRRTGLSIAAGAAGGLAALGLAAGGWKRRTVRRLRQRAEVVETAAGPVEYAVAGSGPPVVVFHGAPGGYDQGLMLGSALGRNLYVIAPSRPGYLGTPLETGRRPEQQAAAVAALLDTLHVRKVAVVAAAGGGPAALQFAIHFPGRVTRLVLWQAVTRRNRLDPRRIAGGFMGTALGALVTLSGLKAAPARALPAPARTDPAARRRLLALVSTLRPIDVRRAGIENDAVWINALPELPLGGIRVPTLIVHGTADTAVPYSHAQATAEGIPDARLVTIEGGTHETGFVDPRAIDAIANFLGEEARAGAEGAGSPAAGDERPGIRADELAAPRRIRRPRRGVLSARSLWSVLSWASALSVASAASLLSVGSFASVLSVGSSGSILSVGSSNSILSIGSSGSSAGVGSGGHADRGARSSPRRRARK